MDMKKIVYSMVVLVLITGCGSSENKSKGNPDNGTSNEIETTMETTMETTIETTKGVYKYKVVNNMGQEVHSTVGDYKVALYSDTKERAYSKSPHKGIVVRLNSEDSELMPIQATYLDKEIVAKIYKSDELVATSDVVEVTDENPVVLIETEI